MVVDIDLHNNEEYCVIMVEDVDEEALETMQIEEEPPIDDEIQPIETFAESESTTDFKGFEALHNNCPWHRRPIALLRCSNRSYTYVWWTTMIVWDVLAKH